MTKPLSKQKLLHLPTELLKQKQRETSHVKKNDFNFLLPVIPISNKKIAKKPLNKSFVKGWILCLFGIG